MRTRFAVTPLQVHPLSKAAVEEELGDLLTSSTAVADSAKEDARKKDLQKEKMKGACVESRPLQNDAYLPATQVLMNFELSCFIFVE